MRASILVLGRNIRLTYDHPERAIKPVSVFSFWAANKGVILKLIRYILVSLEGQVQAVF
jgi:hypothetical protein